MSCSRTQHGDPSGAPWNPLYSIVVEPASICVSTLSSIYISATNMPIAINFYLKHHWGRRKAALGFWPDRIRTGFHGNI